jgi:hypothetical protein
MVIRELWQRSQRSFRNCRLITSLVPSCLPRTAVLIKDSHMSVYLSV